MKETMRPKVTMVPHILGVVAALLGISACSTDQLRRVDLAERFRDVPFVSFASLTEQTHFFLTNKQEIATLTESMGTATVEQIVWPSTNDTGDIIWIGYPCVCPACKGKSCPLCKDAGYGLDHQLYDLARIQADERVGLHLLEASTNRLKVQHFITSVPRFVDCVMTLWKTHEAEAINEPTISVPADK
jgi:hypothetical protein